MEQAFLQVLNMGFTGGAVILLILAARLLLGRAPRIFSYALWSVALFRLLCPVSLSSALSLLPVNPQPVSQELLLSPNPSVHTGLALLDQPVNALLPAPAPGDSVNPLQVWAFAGSWIWLAGGVILLAYSLLSLLRLRLNLRGAYSEGEGVWLSEKVDTPFVVGVFRPRIYLPASLSDAEREYILLHERTHIRRLDHIWRLAAFLVLCVHWFNPLVWIAFFLSCRDMEMSCDEAVVKMLGDGVKKPYSASLLALSCGRRVPGGTPLAFGEGEVKDRVKNVLCYRKPAFWVTLLGGLAVATLCVGLMLNGNRSGETSISFPAYQGGKGPYNYQIYETEPFQLSVEFPAGWTVSIPAVDDQIATTPWTPVTLCAADGTPVGSVGFGIFEDVPDVPQEDYYKVAYSEIRLGSLVSWCNDYAPVRISGTMESATCLLFVNNSFSNPNYQGSAAEAGYVEYPAVVAYDRGMGVYTAMSFQLDSVTEEELAAIAESIRFVR